jgi:hypothetical protein
MVIYLLKGLSGQSRLALSYSSRFLLYMMRWMIYNFYCLSYLIVKFENLSGLTLKVKPIQSPIYLRSAGIMLVNLLSNVHTTRIVTMRELYLEDCGKRSNLVDFFITFTNGCGSGSAWVRTILGIRIRIRIRVKRWIRIRIRIKVNIQEL